ncbi:cyclin N-terminal domain-containing protein 1-like isoform X2 [Cataglyphis hispanica]|uniref:cyclin N-terminal domain-containing protein 1-like isoform X2 n=1 Tax=Cataglyphis hispanica TaxID=1086592 RepID=UPI00217F9DD7|nr:cyclin N-terminal domain-containing protein 1-like isoform X2 [Cataglyphis hispanica]
MQLQTARPSLVCEGGKIGDLTAPDEKQPFLYDWVNHLQEIMEERKQEIINREQFMPCEAITEIVVKAATHIAECLEVDHHVKYMALELFDKFINELYCDCYNRRKNDSDEWFQDYRKRSSTHSPFYLLSCFQVASKVNSHPNILKISQVLELVQVFVKNYEYTRDMVTSMEIEVLKKAGFRMPLYTPVYCIEILLAALKIHFESEKTTENREKLYDTSMLLLDLAYMQHEKLYQLFQSYFVCRSTQMSIEKKDQELRILKSNAFLLSAAIVLCTGYILYPHSTLNNTRLRIVSNLAKLVNATETEIIIMANALYQLVQYHISNSNTDI